MFIGPSTSESNKFGCSKSDFCEVTLELHRTKKWSEQLSWLLSMMSNSQLIFKYNFENNMPLLEIIEEIFLIFDYKITLNTRTYKEFEEQSICDALVTIIAGLLFYWTKIHK